VKLQYSAHNKQKTETPRMKMSSIKSRNVLLLNNRTNEQEIHQSKHDCL